MLSLVCITIFLSSFVSAQQWVNDSWSHASGISYSDWKNYCEVNDDWKERNKCTWQLTGNYSSFIGVYVKLPGASNVRNMTYVADIPYWQVATYKQGQCKQNYIVMWFVVCDSVLCPSLPVSQHGLYLSVTETSNKVIFPKRQACQNEVRQEYNQVYETPSSPGNPAQEVEWDAIRINIDQWCLGLYTVKATGKVAYEELSSIDVPYEHIYHSAQNYVPSENQPGLSRMGLWAYIDAYGNGLLDEPARTAYTMYKAGILPAIETAPGRSDYLLPLFPPSSGKRQQTGGVTLSSADYAKYLAVATLVKDNNVKAPTH